MTPNLKKQQDDIVESIKTLLSDINGMNMHESIDYIADECHTWGRNKYETTLREILNIDKSEELNENVRYILDNNEYYELVPGYGYQFEGIALMSFENTKVEMFKTVDELNKRVLHRMYKKEFMADFILLNSAEFDIKSASPLSISIYYSISRDKIIIIEEDNWEDLTSTAMILFLKMSTHFAIISVICIIIISISMSLIY